MTMKKYLQALYGSFGQIRLYYQVIYDWTGSGLIYGWVLAALTATLLSVHFIVQMHNFAQTEMDHIVSQWPTIIIAKGQVETNVEQPHMIKTENGRVIAVIDTTVNEAELAKQEGVVLVGKDFMLTRNHDETYRRTDFSNMMQGKTSQERWVIDQDKIRSFILALRYMPLMLLPFLIIGQWFVIVAMIVCAAVLSYVITAYMREEFDFETRMRMAAIAITPPVLINQLLQLTSQYSLGMWIVLVLWILHLYVIVIAARKYKETLNLGV
jgi:hypothetical protein